MTKYKIGDVVYPISEWELEHMACEIHFKDKEDYSQELYGVVVKLSFDKSSCSVKWLNSKTRDEQHSQLKSSWWDDDELTTNRDEYIEEYQAVLEFVEDYYCEVE